MMYVTIHPTYEHRGELQRFGKTLHLRTSKRDDNTYVREQKESKEVDVLIRHDFTETPLVSDTAIGSRLNFLTSISQGICIPTIHEGSV